MAKIIEPNLELKLKSAITGLQVAYNEYKNALNAIYDYYRCTGYDDKGNFFMFDGHEELWARLHYSQEVLARQKAIVDGLKAMMEDAE